MDDEFIDIYNTYRQREKITFKPTKLMARLKERSSLSDRQYILGFYYLDDDSEEFFAGSSPDTIFRELKSRRIKVRNKKQLFLACLGAIFRLTKQSFKTEEEKRVLDSIEENAVNFFKYFFKEKSDDNA